MLRYFTLLALLVVSLTAAGARADAAPGAAPAISRPYSVGTSAFMLMNLVPSDEPPVFVQLNAGYQLTPNDRLTAEAITWRYYRPIGIPFWESGVSSSYPGHVREYGVGLCYQRMLWKGLYASLGAVPFWRQYYDAQGDRIGNGFELFLTLRLGYRLLLVNRFFLEPSVAFNAWPIATHVPDGFAAMDDEWPSYFLFEPGLHIGVVF